MTESAASTPADAPADALTGIPAEILGDRDLDGARVLMSGGSRGIGHAIAVALAGRGAHIAMLAKTDTPHPKLAGTVHSAVSDVEAAGGRGLAIVGDLREDADVVRAVETTEAEFGGVDIIINNASAIDLSTIEALDMKRYDLMHDINVRGTFHLSKTAMPHLREAAAAGRHAQVLTLSPPLTDAEGRLDPQWFGRHLGYTMAKYGMSMTTLGLSQELSGTGVDVNSLWPATLIDTAAIRAMPGGEEMVRAARTPAVVAHAALALLSGAAGRRSGEFLTDEQVLAAAGVEDLSDYAVEHGRELIPDIFL
ncbi:SDR family oxidoreductase [Nesterenkonia xinjiangensis]|uniref:Citronellol/citronellal dehydrogenase n=1 Tax=Nesterenkonia xinjiangensis TaxID=225327 RepID=A0A7Z0GLF8_9MICC|nr:SDR family oxidoreductase [Nesterenkonia xinjiangensis]NYJ77311.1 citronellol/citronellal dehydrogenase [Nesterenkonia xinjiangensis]